MQGGIISDASFMIKNRKWKLYVWYINQFLIPNIFLIFLTSSSPSFTLFLLHIDWKVCLQSWKIFSCLPISSNSWTFTYLVCSNACFTSLNSINFSFYTEFSTLLLHSSSKFLRRASSFLINSELSYISSSSSSNCLFLSKEWISFEIPSNDFSLSSFSNFYLHSSSTFRISSSHFSIFSI